MIEKTMNDHRRPGTRPEIVRRSGMGAAPARRPWEPMSLTRVGAFGEVLRGATGPLGETGGTKRRSAGT